MKIKVEKSLARGEFTMVAKSQGDKKVVSAANGEIFEIENKFGYDLMAQYPDYLSVVDSAELGTKAEKDAKEKNTAAEAKAQAAPQNKMVKAEETK